jgi:hypothetical protein
MTAHLYVRPKRSQVDMLCSSLAHLLYTALLRPLPQHVFLNLPRARLG